MKLIKKLCSVAAAAALALSLAACSSSDSAAEMNSLINTSLAQKGSAYTVSAADANSETVSLIKEAVETYDLYRNSLINTAKLESDLYDQAAEVEESMSFSELMYSYVSYTDIINQVNKARMANLKTAANFQESVESLNSRGISKVYAIDGAAVNVYDTQAVADYVAGLVTEDSEVYVSDLIELPVLDDDIGTYTGQCTSMRYAYIKPAAK